MSDSDVDLFPNNGFTFQNESTTVSARGPNTNASNLTSLSFRNNIMTSTMNMPRNFERQQYLGQSTCYRHTSAVATSPPMSLRSESSFRPRNYQHMYYPHGMSSQRPLINGRSGSPMSMRSIDSNASTLSAVDIAIALKNRKFNKYDLRVIKDAYNQLMKGKMRRKIEKRRNLRLFLKGQRRKSGDDSGELGSDSSISSDECRSTKNSVYKDNMSSCRSTKSYNSDIKRTMIDSNLYKDCTDNFKQNTFKNMLCIAPRNATVHLQNREPNELPLKQKDRSGFLLPSQRFNQSMASVPIPENIRRGQNLPSNKNNLKSHYNTTRNDSEMESEQEEIFSEIIIREKNIYNAGHNDQNEDPRKRCIEADEVMSQNKRSKLLISPPKNKINMQEQPKNKKNSHEFEFVKPQFPVRKSGNVKVKETLLAKSATTLSDEVVCTEHVSKPPASQIQCDQNDENKLTETNEQPDLTQQSNSDLSMRPSFIKRKLYTQKFDLLESKNLSSDNLGANSPQANVYSSIQKEKNKARKLVTTQSCLRRDVREDNNFMDLIHKIVPPDRMNVTNVTNKSKVTDATKNKSEDDRWDVTSVINTGNNEDESDTYTDEEIFNNENGKKQSNNNEDNNKKIKQNHANKKKQTNEKKSVNEKKGVCSKVLIAELDQTNENKSVNENTRECEVLVKKLPVKENDKKYPASEKQNVFKNTKDKNKENIPNYVKSFWDTDFDSDEDGQPVNKVKEKQNGNHGIIQKATNNQENKILDACQSKSVWNNKSNSTVILKSHSFVSQIKAVNVNKSFTKKANEHIKQKKNSQSKEKVTKMSGKTADTLKKTSPKRIVLDTDNYPVSDNTQNETVITTNSKTRASRVMINGRTNMDRNDDKKSRSQIKGKASKSPNDKAQANEVNKKTSTRRPLPSPKDFSCCKEPIQVSKKAKKEIETKAKSNTTGLDNYNSTFSDNTLDDLIKRGNRTRALRATTIKKLENSKRDDSQMLNMTLRSRRLDTSFTEGNDSPMLNMTLRSRRLDTSFTEGNDSPMLNMTLRSRRLDKSFTKGKNENTKLPSRKAEVKARNTSNSSQVNDELKKNKLVVKGHKTVSKNSDTKHTSRINNKAVSTAVHNKRAVQCK